MKSEEIAQGIWNTVIIEGLESYRTIFNSTPIEEATHFFYQGALRFFASLNDQQKAIFFLIIKQVEIDTVATTLAILDGDSALNGESVDFVLTIKDRIERLNGNLSELFLTIAEIDRGE